VLSQAGGLLGSLFALPPPRLLGGENAAVLVEILRSAKGRKYREMLKECQEFLE